MDPRVNQVKTLVETHLARDLRADKIARQLGLSVSRLQHLFKDGTGTTLVRYQQAIRIERAGELLERTTLSIKEIASEVGVGDTSHFIRDFRKAKGFSPRRYRLNFLSRIAAKAKDGKDIGETRTGSGYNAGSKERRTNK